MLTQKIDANMIPKWRGDSGMYENVAQKRVYGDVSGFLLVSSEAKTRFFKNNSFRFGLPMR